MKYCTLKKFSKTSVIERSQSFWISIHSEDIKALLIINRERTIIRSYPHIKRTILLIYGTPFGLSMGPMCLIGSLLRNSLMVFNPYPFRACALICIHIYIIDLSRFCADWGTGSIHLLGRYYVADSIKKEGKV
jgi:hypothetical protein